jgi:hypothetical protein
MIKTLTESERNTLTNGLRVAAGIFEKHAEELQTVACPKCLDRPGFDGIGRVCRFCNGAKQIANTNEAHLRLAKQFTLQQVDSVALAYLVEDAQTITVETE